MGLRRGYCFGVVVGFGVISGGRTSSSVGAGSVVSQASGAGSVLSHPGGVGGRRSSSGGAVKIGTGSRARSGRSSSGAVYDGAVSLPTRNLLGSCGGCIACVGTSGAGAGSGSTSVSVAVIAGRGGSGGGVTSSPSLTGNASMR